MNKSGSSHDYSELMDLSTPLDLSFMKIKDMSGIKLCAPKKVRLGRAPPRGESKKFITKAVWLNSNSINSMVGFEKFINSILHVPESLAWIDLSYNRISAIDESVTHFPNITIMYLHGNRIGDFQTVTVIRKMKKLKRLTLHGNPIARETGYRPFIIHLLPQVVNLDFVPISIQDRNIPPPPGTYKKYGEILNQTS